MSLTCGYMIYVDRHVGMKQKQKKQRNYSSHTYRVHIDMREWTTRICAFNYNAFLVTMYTYILQ